MAHAPARSPLALLDLLDLCVGRDADALGLRPPLARGGLGALAKRAPGQRVPELLTSFVRWRDGQREDATSLHPSLDWRLLAAEEITFDDEGFSLFWDRTRDQAVRVDREGAILGRFGTPQHVTEWLQDVLVHRGVSLARPPRPVRPIGEVLEELLGLVRESACLPLRPSDPVALERLVSVGALPLALRSWFTLHDGQEGRAAEDEPGRGLHPGRRAYASSASEAHDTWQRLRAERLVPPATSTCVPLFVGDDERVLAVETAAPHEGELLWLERDDGTWHGRPLALSFVEWLEEAVAARRRAAEAPELQVPEDHAPMLARRRVITFGGILYERAAERHDLMGGARRVVGADAAFASHAHWWGCSTPEGIRRLLAALLGTEASDERDDGALAWDLGRASALAGRAYVAGLLSAEEAWASCLASARRAQTRFDGWESFGTAYATRYRTWCEARGVTDTDELAEVEAVVARLLGPGGAWRQTPWETPIDDVPVPTDPPVRVRDVGPDTWLEALHDAEPGDRLRLAPGTYGTPIRVCTSVELVAAGPGVVLAPEGVGAAIVVAGASLFLEGIEVRAEGASKGAPADGVVVESGFFCMRGGAISAERNALEVTSHEHALLVGVTLHARRGAACRVASEGELGCSNVHVEHSGTGVEALGTARMDGGSFVDTETHAWLVRGGEVVAHDVVARGTGLTTAAATDRGTLRLRGCTLEDNAEVGARVGEGATVELVGVTFRRSGGGHLQVLDTHETEVLDCTFDTCNASAVLLIPGEGARFEGCTVTRSGLAAVLANGATDDYPTWTGGSLEGHDDAGAIFVTGGARMEVEDVALRAGAVVGVEVSHGGSLWLRGAKVEATSSAAWVHHDAKLTWEGGALRSGAGNAILATDAGRLYLEDVEVRAAGVGVALGGGTWTRVKSCRFVEAGAQAVLCDGAVVCVEGCTMESPGEEAVYVTNGGAAVVHACTTRGCGDLALRLDGARALVHRCALLDGRSAAIGAFGATALWLVDTRIVGTASAGTELADDTEAWLSGVTVEAPGENAIFAYDRARVRVVG
ncbi:MAG: right-handed parallel beta-helix repeat-containing protein, partial [Polyangiales bacterium]